MRTVLLSLACWMLAANSLVSLAYGDDKVINTPVIASRLTGDWERKAEDPDGFKPLLTLDHRLSGSWQKSKPTLPMTIAWFVEGGELRILSYYEPNGAFNYRVRTVMIPYELVDDQLTLTIDGQPQVYLRVKRPTPR